LGSSGSAVSASSVSALPRSRVPRWNVAEVKEALWPLAFELGARSVVGNVGEWVRKDLDVIVDFVGVGVTMLNALRAIRRSGRVVVVGMGASQVTLDTMTLIRRQSQIYGSYGGTKDDISAVYELLARGRIRRRGFSPVSPLPSLSPAAHYRPCVRFNTRLRSNDGTVRVVDLPRQYAPAGYAGVGRASHGGTVGDLRRLRNDQRDARCQRRPTTRTARRCPHRRVNKELSTPSRVPTSATRARWLAFLSSRPTTSMPPLPSPRASLRHVTGCRRGAASREVLVSRRAVAPRR
jgi:hypothetical protein